MENKKWQNVLVEWVNCLKLAKNIQCIEDLRNGEFLSNLQKIITKSPNPEKDTLTFAFDILSVHYPNYVIANKTDIHLADLPIYDLKAVVSLLMHYTCIYDRRDVLTSPLCHSLSQNNQLMIRNYLQNVTNSVSNEDLEHIVLNCIEANKVLESPSLHWLSGGSSNSNQSPLQNILSTPVSRMGRLQEKEKRIAKLESELEMEKYEKRELQEQLDLCSNKQTKLEKMLEQKNSEITGLKLEITELENRTPPNFQDTDARMTQKRLRIEIENLEIYVKQLETEEGKLQDEKDAMKNKLKNLEFDCVMWQEKFFAQERSLEIITEQSKTQEDQLANLKTLCDELTAMLNERKRLSDISVDESLQASPLKSIENTFSSENLAHSVVEVQLKDVQKELSQVNVKLIHTQEHCKSLENERQKLVVELANKKESLEQTLEELQGCHKEIAEMGINMINQNKDLSLLNEKLVIINEELFSKDKEIVALKDQMIALENNFVAKEASLNKNISQAKENLLQKEEHIEKLTRKIQEFSNQCDKIARELSYVKQAKAEIEKDSAEKIQKQNENIQMTTCLLEKTKLSLQEQEMMNKDLENANESLKVSLESVDNQCTNLREELSSVNEKNLSLQDRISRLGEELDTVRHDLETNINGYNNLRIEKDNEIKILNDAIEKSSQNNLVIKEELVKLEKEVIYSMLEHSEVQFEEKTTLDTIKSFQNYIQQIQQSKNDLNELLKEKEITIKNQESQVINLTQELDEVQQQNKYTTDCLNDNLEKLRQHIASQSNELSLLNEKLSALTQELFAKDNELINMSNDFSTKETLLNEKLSEKAEKLLARDKALEDVMTNLQELSIRYNIVEEQFINSQTNANALQEELQFCQKELLTTKQFLSSLKEEFCILKQAKEECESSLNHNLEMHEEKINEITSVLRNTELSLKDQELLNKDLNTTNEALKVSLVNVESECRSLRDELISLKQENVGLCDRNLRVEEELDMIKNDLETQGNAFNNLTAEKNKQIQDMKDDLEKSAKIYATIKKEIIKLAKEMLYPLLENPEIYVEQENTIDTIKCFYNYIQQIQQTINNLNQLLKEKDVNIRCHETQVASLTQNLAELRQEKQKEIESLNDELEKQRIQIASQSNEMCLLNEKLTALLHEISDKNKGLIDLSNEFSMKEVLLNKKLSEKTEELLAKDKMLDDVAASLQDIVTRYQDSEEQLTCSRTNLYALKEELQLNKNDLAISKDSVSSLEKELNIVKLEKEDCESKVETYEEKIKETAALLHEQKSLNDNLRDTNQDLISSLTTIRIQHEDIEKELATIKEENVNLRREVCKIQEKLISVNNDLENKVLVCNKLTTLHEQKDIEIHILNCEIVKLKQHNATIKDNILRLEKTISCSNVEELGNYSEERSITDILNCLEHHILQYHETKYNLNELLNDKDVNIRKQEIEVSNLTRKIEDMQMQQNTEIATLKNELAKSKQSILNTEQDIVTLQSDLLSILNRFVENPMPLEETNNVNIVKCIEQQILELKERNSNLGNTLSEKNANLRKQECEITNLSTKISELQLQHSKEIGALKSTILKLEETNSVIKESIIKLENKIVFTFLSPGETLTPSELNEKSVLEVIVSLEGLIENLMEKEVDMQKLLNVEKEKVEALTTEIIKVNEEKIKLDEATTKDSVIIQNCKSEITSLSKKISVLEEERLQDDKIIKEEVVKLSGILSFLLSEDKARFELNQSPVDIIKSIENDIEIVKREKFCLEETIAEKNNTIMKQQIEISELMQKIDNLFHDKNILDKQLEKLKKDSTKEKEKLESHYSVLLDEHKSTFENLKTVSEKVTTEMNNCKIENQLLQEELAVTVKEKQNLEALLKDCQFNYNKMKEESKLIEDEYDKVRQKYNELEKDMEENMDTIDVLKKKGSKLESDMQNLTEDLIKVSRSRDELLENQTKIIKETENNVIRAHENAIEVKNDLTRQLESLETQVESEISKKKEIQDELNNEIKIRQQVETNLTKISTDYNQLKKLLYEVSSHFFSEDNADFISNDQTMVIQNFNKYVDTVQEKLKKLEDFANKSSEMKQAILSLQEEKAKIVQLKEEETMSLESLQTDYDLLMSKYNQIISSKDNLEREYQNLQKQFKSLEQEHKLLLSKFDQVVATNDRFEEEYNLLQMKHESLVNKMEASSPKDCSSFLAVTEAFKKKLEVIFSQRNMLESLLGNMRMTMLSVQQNMNRITIPVFTFKQIFEKKEALEIIMEDIYKHSVRITKQSNELVFKLIRLYDKCLEQLANSDTCLSEPSTDQSQSINDIVERITDLNDRTSDALEQLKALNKEIENILQKQELKASKDKENVLTTSNKLNLNVEKFKEEEWRKKNMMLKQKLTLSENSKSNLEKKLRQLQEENKKLTSQQPNIEGDAYYKMLLQEHMAVKEDHERALQECKKQYKKLLEEHEELKNEKKAHTEISSQHELLKLQQNYEVTLNANSKMEVEIVTLRQLIEERNVQISELNEIKEAYERLLEENNKMMTEVDTLKYKRARDRDEFVRLLKKDRDEMEMKETRRIQQIRAEYEKKLEKMKDKMLTIYKEEIHKEMDRVKSGHDQNSFLHTIENLRSDLFEAEQKISFLEAERDVLRSRQYQHPEPSFFLSRESLCSVDFKMPDSVVRNPRDRDSIRSTSSQISRRAIEESNSLVASEANHMLRKTSSSSLAPSSERQEHSRLEDRRVFTLPRATAMNVIEEVTVTKRRSISGVPTGLGQNFQMEDEEDDCFNNKYLTDLKEGRCNVQSNNTNRFSELAWRNSMQPPHLKSSYPAELQFASPSTFKEEEIKAGNIEMDNSLSRLLPGEKPRKKDFGTTSYKKPGPPTPSKNGGRLSLQGNEIHPLREHNMETKTPKRTTPNRIKALFMGKVNSVRDTSESQSSPRKRVSFFRKPK